MYQGKFQPVLIDRFLFEIDELEDFINRTDINVLEIINFDKSEYGYYVTIMYQELNPQF